MTEVSVKNDSALEALVGQVADEFLRRQAAGERPDIEEYAASHPEAADVLRKVLASLRLFDASEPGASATGDHPAGTLGDFRLIREVGRGGMGIVYEAEQISLSRRVALKVLPFAATMDPRHLQRFHNEARAAAALEHPHIVPVYGVGCERAVHFYAMKFIEGRTLAAMIAERRQRGGQAPLPADQPTTPHVPGAPAAETVERAAASTERPALDKAYYRRVAEWGVQAAEALDHAHQMGIVHRDVKPANLLVDAAGRLWVTDFDLAQVQSDVRVTMTGDLVGTLRYMSPEQALAKRVVIDHRTDVYSLGATLYELLTLEPAFSGGDRQELLRQIAFEEPKPPRRLNKAIPAELETIILKALEKNPSERYVTARELADDLRHWLEDRPIRARRPSRLQRAGKWARRHPAVVRSAMLLVLLAALASATGAWLLWQEEGRTRDAWTAESQQRQAAEKAQGVAEKRLKQIEKANEILAAIFFDLDPNNGEEPGRPVLRVQLGERLEQAAALLDGEVVDDPIILARLQHGLGHSLWGLGHYEKALPLLEKACQTREAALGTDHPDTLDSKLSLAKLYLEQRKYAQAEPLLQEILRGSTAKLGADDPITLDAKCDLAMLYLEQGKFKQAEALFQEALQGSTDKLGADHPKTLSCKGNLAILYLRQGKYEQAEKLMQEELQGAKSNPKIAPSYTLNCKHNLGSLYLAQGKYEQAEKLMQEVLREWTTQMGADNPKTLVSMNELALVYREQAKYDQAEALFQEALQGFTAQLRADAQETLICKGNLATLYREQGKYEQAEKLFQDVLQGAKANPKVGPFFTPNYKNNLATLYREQGKYEQAEKLMQEVLREWTTLLGADNPNTLLGKYNLAVIYWHMHKLDQSVPLFEEVLRSRKVKPGVDHPQTLLAAFNLAINYADAGRLDEAVALIDEYLPRALTVLPMSSPIRTLGRTNGGEIYARVGRYDKAEPLLRESADVVKQQAGAESAPYAGQMAVLGMNLLQQKKFAEAEKVVRESLAIREKTQPDAWTTFNTMSMLGGALVGQKKYADAEPLLLQGYEGMKQREKTIPPPGKDCMPEAVERLVQLYDAWGKHEEADDWRKKMPPELLPPPKEESGR